MMRAILPLVSTSLAAAVLSAPAHAEITEANDQGFVTRHEVIVEASAKEAWLALISPARWWSSAHTWSADAGNLKLTPQAGGCFCETIPEVDEPGRFTLEGSVEHMRVIQAYPEQALRMVGALGPLQSEPVTGVLTIALTSLDGANAGRTRIVWEYNVGGSMRFEIPVISKAVDGVMGLQARSLGEHLGEFEMIEGKPAPSEPQEAEEAEEQGEDVVIDPDSVLEVAEEKPKGPSVDEAFGDLSDKPD